MRNEEIYLSLVIPCYNEEVVGICALITGHFELIFVDDGSKDGTLKILRQLANQGTRIHYISFSRNFGKEAAMLAGLQAVRGEYIVILDADGQDSPALIPQMLEAVVSGEYDCAGTRRVNRIGEPSVKQRPQYILREAQ